MKNFLSTILAIIMIFNMGMCIAYASDTSATAEISSVSALPGEKVEVFISIECADGIKTLSFLDFTYDSTVLTIVESECAWLADGKLKDIDFENNASIITFEDNTVYSGNILKLVFTVSEDAEIGTLPISCSAVATQMVDKVETEISITITEGKINIVDSVATIDDFEYELNENGIVITGYIGDKSTVIIADSYEIDGVSYNVVEIGESAFEANENIKSVTIPATVTKIGDYAFYDCTNLTSVTVLGKETEIGSTAFGYYYISRKEDGVVEGFTIYGYKNSTADVYAATDENITFVPLAEECAHTGGTATCVDKAICETCGESYGEINSDNHKNLVVDEAVAPTCISNGITEGSHCDACNETVVAQEEVSATGHNYESVVTSPTCTEAGYTIYTCSACSDTYTSDDIAALGHSYDNGVVTTAPTCTADGVKTFTCSGCGDTYTETVSATGHTEIEISAVAATCTTAGFTAGVKCSVCNEVLIAPVEIPALGHSYNDGVVTTKPSCATEGVKMFTCAICGDTYTEEVAVFEHTAGETVVENEVTETCGTDGGYDAVVYCTVCDGEISRETVVVPATGEHSYDVVVTEPTCTESGYTTYTCTTCGDSYTADETEAYGHSFVDDVCEYCGETAYNYSFYIQEPSRYEIRNKDGIKLHANIDGTAPEGAYVEWTADNGKFDTEELDGNILKIIAKNKGWTTFTATLYADGTVLATDTVEMYSNSGFFQKIGGFFRSLFGTTKVYEY